MTIDWRNLLEGGGGLPGALLRGGLAPLGLAYGGLLSLRRAAYTRDWLKRQRLSVPVVSVGNLTAGGTGKTPFTARLAELLGEMGHRPAILTRGYGAADPDRADEVQWYRRRLPGVPVLAGSDRAAAGRRALAAGADVLVMDDGFQHLRLCRDLDIVLLDAVSPWGGGRPLPAGLLREFPQALAAAGVFCLTRCDQAGAAAEKLSTELAVRWPGRPILRSRHAPARLTELSGQNRELSELRGRRVWAFAGIGRPAAFGQTLAELGAEVVELTAWPDHHAYAAAELDRLAEQARRQGAQLITTEKDAAKLATVAPQAEILVLGVELALADEAPLCERLRQIF